MEGGGLHWDAEAMGAMEGLQREGLVERPEPDTLHLESVALEQVGNGEERADAHLVGLAARDDKAAIDPQRCQAALLRQRRIHDDAGRGTVRELACIAGRNVAVLAGDRLEPR